MYGDISANLHDERKTYSGVGWQQGRVLTDADFNADQQIAAAHNEALLRQIICPAASPDEGFRITNPVLQSVTLADGQATFDTYTFDIAQGAFVIGGLRLRRGPDHGLGFTDQSEWLFQSEAVANYPPAPTDAELAALPSEQRSDLAYLEVAEYAVRATEDREIHDPAIGAADTTTRRRPLGRVRVLADVPDDCAEAAAALRTALAVNGQFSDDGVELASNARLTVAFAADGAPSDPCQPREIAGYIGAENHTLKVMLTAANRLVFNIDHGEPLYRVQLSPQGAGQKVTFLTPPRDPVLFPIAGQVIEILPWAALLPNGEKTAEARGHLAPITASYDPEGRFVEIAPPVDADWETWLAGLGPGTLSPHDPAEEARYFYARIWQPPVTGAGPDTPFDTVNPVVLADFGIELQFHAFGIDGDHWSISLRTAEPQLVLPWRLMDAAGAPPAGPRRFYAGLGVIRWNRGPGGADPVGSVHDCREHLHRLCEIEGCCTLTVGDGHTSHGVVDDLQAAIDSLPAAGGEICLLPGRHIAAATLIQRTMVSMHGCGPRTVVTHGAGQTDPVISIRGGSRIALRDFAIETDGVVGIDWRLGPERIELRRLEITAGGGRAVNGATGSDVTIEDCRFLGTAFAEPLTPETVLTLRHLLVLGGAGIVVRRNRLVVAAARATLLPLGGLQILGDSRAVLIKDNLISGGNGFGIALGSYSFRPLKIAADDFTLAADLIASADERGNIGFLAIADDGCPEIDPEFPPPPGGDGGGLVPVSDGNVEDVVIDRNRIRRMGLSGISVVGWFTPAASRIDTIETNRLVIEDNDIRDCVRLNLGASLSEELRQYAAFGGITLADASDLAISRNRIEGCGASSTAPVCGIFVRSGEEIQIDENTIIDNGMIAEAGTLIRPGRSGGIVIAMVTSNLTRGNVGALSDRGPQNRASALKVHGNRVVAREGRALSASGYGPMAVADNQFASYGANTLIVLILILLSSRFGDRLTTGGKIDPDDQIAAAAFLDALIAAIAGTTVTLINLGISQEQLFLGQVSESQAGSVNSGFGDTLVAAADTGRFVVGGEILFNDNQVVFDALSQGITLSLCSVLLLTLDDVSMSDNQCVIDSNIDFVAVDAVAVGFASARVQGNRFKESPFRTFLSALTMGYMNATQDNQGTHCFAILGTLKPEVNVGGNTAVIDTNRHMVPDFWCERRGLLTDGLASAFPVLTQATQPIG